MKVILQFGQVRFLLEGETFQLLCDEIVRCLAPLVPLERNTICLQCGFDEYEAAVQEEMGLLREAEEGKEKTEGKEEEDDGSKGSAAAQQQRKLSFSSSHSSPPLAGECHHRLRSPSNPAASTYVFSQETFEAVEGRVLVYDTAAAARRARLAALGLVDRHGVLLHRPVNGHVNEHVNGHDSEHGDGHVNEHGNGLPVLQRRPLPVLTLDPYVSTSSPVAGVYNAAGHRLQRRPSLPSVPPLHAAPATADRPRRRQVVTRLDPPPPPASTTATPSPSAGQRAPLPPHPLKGAPLYHSRSPKMTPEVERRPPDDAQILNALRSGRGENRGCVYPLLHSIGSAAAKGGGGAVDSRSLSRTPRHPQPTHSADCSLDSNGAAWGGNGSSYASASPAVALVEHRSLSAETAGPHFLRTESPSSSSGLAHRNGIGASAFAFLTQRDRTLLANLLAANDMQPMPLRRLATPLGNPRARAVSTPAAAVAIASPPETGPSAQLPLLHPRERSSSQPMELYRHAVFAATPKRVAERP